MLKKLFVFLISFLLFITNGFSVSAEAEQTTEKPGTSEEVQEDSGINREEFLDALVQADGDKDIRDIFLDEAVYAEFTEMYQRIYYRYVPETTGKYVFESFDAYGNPYVTLYDEDFSRIASDDEGADDEEGNFRLICTLTAGNTYYFCAMNDILDEDGYYSATLSYYQAQMPTYIGFNDDEYSLRKNRSYDLNDFIEYEPYNAEFIPEVESSNESIISYADGMLVTGDTAGTAVVTVTTENGLATAAEFNVGNYASNIDRDNYNTVYLYVGEQKTLEYILYPQDEDHSDEKVTFEISWINNNCITLDENGVVTANAVGQAGVYASITNGNSVYYSISVVLPVESVSFTDSVNYIALNGSRYIGNYLSVSPDGADFSSLKIESSDESVVSVIDSYLYGSGKGTATVTVSTDSELSTSAEFVVGNYASHIYSVGMNDIVLTPGETLKLDYSLTSPNDDTSDEIVTFELDYANNDCIAVDENGIVTALRYGEAYVRARILCGDSVGYYITVAADPEEIHFKNPENYMALSEDRWIWNDLYAEPDEAYFRNAEITVEDTSIISYENGYLYGKKAGTTKVTATTPGGLTASANYTVGNYAGWINIVGDYDITLSVGDTYQLEYQLGGGNGNYSDEQVTWEIAEGYQECVAINSTGLMTAVDYGYTYIIARTKSNHTDSRYVRVIAQPESISFRKDTNYIGVDSYRSIWNYLEVSPSEAYGGSLTVISDSEDIIEVNGNYIRGLKKGTAKITVKTDNGLTASADFVVGNYADSINCEEYDNYIKVGEEKQLKYSLWSNSGNFEDEVVEWKINYGSCIELSGDGLVKAVSTGYAEVSATISNGNNTYFYIYAYSDPESIAFRNETNYIGLNSGLHITNYLDITPYDSQYAPLILTSSNPEVVRVQDKYLYGISKGTAEITVTTESGLVATGTFVVGNYASYIERIGDYTVSMKIGEEKKLEYKLYPDDADLSDEEVVWEIDYNGNGCISLDTATGTVKALGYGTAGVRASIKNGYNIYYDINIRKTPTSLSFTKSENYLDKYYGHNIWSYLTCEPYDAEGYELEITSSDTSVVSVNDNRYLYGYNNGTATITVKTDTGLTASAKFTVGDYAASINREPYQQYMTVGESQQLKYTLYPENCKDEEIVWEIGSGSDDCLTLDQNGNVTATSYGRAEIFAVGKAGASAYYYIYVVPEPQKLFFSDLNYYLGIKSSMYIWNNLKAIPGLSQGAKINLKSSDEKIVSVNNEDREITGVSAGTAIITASTEDGLIAKTKVTVGKYADWIESDTYDRIMKVGETAELKYTLHSNAGDYSEEEVTWHLDYATNNCISLNENGRIEAKAPGYGYVYAQIKNGDQTYFYITVTESPTAVSFTSDQYFVSSESSQYMSLVITPSTASGAQFDFISSDPSVVSINQYGQSAYASYVKDGTVTVKAVSKDDAAVYAETKVTAYTPVAPESISAPATAQGYVGYVTYIPVTILPQKAQKGFTVSLSNDNAQLSSSSNTGYYIKGSKAGSTIVTVTTADGKLTAKTTIKIIDEMPETDSYYFIGHTNELDNEAINTYQYMPEEYTCIVGETYGFEIDYESNNGIYPYDLGSDTRNILKKTGLFENLQIRGGGGAGMGASYTSYIMVMGTASKAGTAEVELVKGHKTRIRVLDFVQLDNEITADSSISSAVKKAISESDLGLKYFMQCAAGDLKGLNSLTAGTNEKIVIQTWLEIAIKDYRKDSFGNTSLTLDVQPMYRIEALAKTADNTAKGKDLVSATKLDISFTSQLMIPTADAFSGIQPKRVTVQHKKDDGSEYTYEALYDENLVIFNNPDGFSEFVINAIVQSYKEPVYTWTEISDGYEVTATAESEEDDPAITETVKAVYSVKTEPTCANDGEGVYTATFSNAIFTTQYKYITLPATGEHKYNLSNWVWADDYSYAYAIFYCRTCGDEKSVEATITKSGNTYTATVVFEGQTYTDTKTTESGLPTSIELNKTTAEMATKSTLQLTATIKPSSAKNKKVIWTSSDEDVATVDQNGKVTALRYGQVTITATSEANSSVKAICEIQTRFYDVNDPKKYYYTPVYWAADNEITTGYDKVYFGPEKNCTRQELAIFLWRLAGKPEVSGTLPFTDTNYSESSASFQAILWCSQNGIVKGYSDGSFKPKNNIERKDAMIMLYRLAGKPDVEGEIKFPDVVKMNLSKTSDTYRAILWGVNNGITNGYKDGNFQPKTKCLREHIVTFIYRADKIINP